MSQATSPTLIPVYDINCFSHRAANAFTGLFVAEGLFTRRSRSLSTRQISSPSSSYLAGSVSFIICCISRPRRESTSERGSDMEHPQRRRCEELHLNLRRGAVTEITTGSMSSKAIFHQLTSGFRDFRLANHPPASLTYSRTEPVPVRVERNNVHFAKLSTVLSALFNVVKRATVLKDVQGLTSAGRERAGSLSGDPQFCALGRQVWQLGRHFDSTFHCSCPQG